MRNKDVLLPVFAVTAGFVALALRRWELTTAFEPDTGLAIAGMPATWALIGFCVAAVLVMALLSHGKYSDVSTYDRAFSATGNKVYLMLMVGAAFLMMGACATEAFTLPTIYADAVAQQQLHRGPSPALAVFPRVLLTALAAASGFCLLKLGRNNYRAEGRGKFSTALLVPSYTACLWLVVAYQSRSGDPVLLRYVWELFAIIAAVLGTYFMAGFSFERGRVGRTIFFLSCGVIFIPLTLGDGHSVASLLLYAAFLLYLLSSLMLLLFNATRPVVERMPEERPEFHIEDLIREDDTNE